MNVSSVSNELYQYLQTLSQQQNTSGGFFSEPALVYNNINNGMGIVGCLTGRKVLVFSGKIRR
jgi:hypothetical protein